jgi:hypothetical protein
VDGNAVQHGREATARAPIRTIRPATAHEWDTAWRACPYATYFHSRAWAEIWTEYTKGQLRPEPRMAIFCDGTRAVLPLSVRRRFRGLDRMAFSTPAWNYGGWLSDAPLGEAHARALRGVLNGKLGCVTWRLNPFDPASRPAVTANLSRFAQADETHVLSLEHGMTGVRAGWGTKQNWSIARTRRHGVTVREARGEEDWRAYFGLYELSLQRWGEGAHLRYAWPLFEILRRSAGDVRLWLAECEGRAIAGTICLYAGSHVVSWHSAADAAGFRVRPVPLLLATVIEDACARGARWFDFNPSAGLAGVVAFKKSFGAEPLACPLVTVRPRWAPLLLRTLTVMKVVLDLGAALAAGDMG